MDDEDCADRVHGAWCTFGGTLHAVRPPSLHTPRMHSPVHSTSGFQPSADSDARHGARYTECRTSPAPRKAWRGGMCWCHLTALTFSTLCKTATPCAPRCRRLQRRTAAAPRCCTLLRVCAGWVSTPQRRRHPATPRVRALDARHCRPAMFAHTVRGFGFDAHRRRPSATPLHCPVTPLNRRPTTHLRHCQRAAPRRCLRRLAGAWRARF